MSWFPAFGAQARRIWWRNFSAWRKYGTASTLLNFGEPVFELAAFGFGLGTYIVFPRDVSYVEFLAPGLLAGLAMTAASWDMAFCVHERMHATGVYEAMVTAPVRARDIAGGEILWEATRSVFYGTIFLLVLGLLGLVRSPAAALGIPPLLGLVGMIFGPPAMLVALLAKTSEHMFFYFTLCLTPMFFFSGVYFPAERLPDWAHAAVEVLPLSHAVRVSRFLVTGTPCDLGYDLGVLVAWFAVAQCLPVAVLKRKLSC